MKLYECGVRFDKMQSNGAVKRLTEYYLVDALTFTEAEARIIQEQTPFVSGDMDVVSIKRTNFCEVVYDKGNFASGVEAEAQKILGQNKNAADTADKWFRAKLNFVTIDEKTARERKTSSHFIVNAGSLDAARTIMHNHMKGTMADYEIATLDETRIMDVYLWTANDETRATDN